MTDKHINSLREISKKSSFCGVISERDMPKEDSKNTRRRLKRSSISNSSVDSMDLDDIRRSSTFSKDEPENRRRHSHRADSHVFGKIVKFRRAHTIESLAKSFSKFAELPLKKTFQSNESYSKEFIKYRDELHNQCAAYLKTLLEYLEIIVPEEEIDLRKRDFYKEIDMVFSYLDNLSDKKKSALLKRAITGQDAEVLGDRGLLKEGFHIKIDKSEKIGRFSGIESKGMRNFYIYIRLLSELLTASPASNDLIETCYKYFIREFKLIFV